MAKRLRYNTPNPVSLLGIMTRLVRYGLPDAASLVGAEFDLTKARPVRIGDNTLYVVPQDFIGARILISREHEPHVTRVIKRQLAKGDVFVDIGANVGWFVLVGAQCVGPSGHVYAFEALPQNAELIRTSVQASGLADRVTLTESAVSNTKGQLRFTNVGSNGGVVTDHASSQAHYLTVDCDTIDHMLDGVDVSLVKMDVEAHEPFVLEGMAATIARCRPTIVTEFHPWAMSLNNAQPPVAFLESIEAHGYNLQVIEPDSQLTDPYTPRQIVALYENHGDEEWHMDLLCQPRG